MFPKHVRNLDPDPADPAAPGGGAAKPDVTPVATDPQSSSATIPSSSDPAPAADDKKYSFFETIPSDLKEKPYLKDVQNFEQLYKKLDGAQELIGKRPAGIPGDDAPQEEKEAFAKSWGRPEKPEEYKSPEVKLPEGVQKDPELEKFAKEIFFEAGLNQKQVDIIQGKYEAKILEMMGKQPDAAAADAEFDTMTTELFKDRKDAVLENGRLLLEENAPEQFKEHIASLDNKTLTLLSAVLDGVREKYISEDVMPSADDVKGGGGESVDELRNQARLLMAKPEYTSKSHKDHAAVAADVKSIYDRIARLEARKK